MKWSIQQLRSFQHKELKIDNEIDMRELMQRDPEIRDISPVHVVGRAETNQQRAAFYLTITGKMILPCSKTLVDVEYPFSIQTRDFFLFDPSYSVDAEEEEIHQVEGNTVDLIPYISEQILLQKPLRVISDEEIVDPIAPPEGKGWQIVSEDNHKKKVDPRLADLANFFDKE
jgi:uncharacterized protein